MHPSSIAQPIPALDLKLHLQTTDYGNFLSNEAGPLAVSTIDEKLKEKLVTEFQHVRNQCVEPMAKFLDYITYSYMIDNIILLITGALHDRDISEVRRDVFVWIALELTVYPICSCCPSAIPWVCFPS